MNLNTLTTAFQAADARAAEKRKSTANKERRFKEMIKVYGMPTCPYCDYVHEQIKGREDEFQYINIGENIRNMSAFTRLRDTDPVFDRMKAMGDVGIPAFVFEDGRVSIDPADAGLVEYGSPAACSIEDHKSGRKGC
jgi:glutaredoxin-related protein